MSSSAFVFFHRLVPDGTLEAVAVNPAHVRYLLPGPAPGEETSTTVYCSETDQIIVLGDIRATARAMRTDLYSEGDSSEGDRP